MTEEKKGPTRETLLRQIADELHKPVKRKHKTRKIFVSEKDETWSVDLADMQQWAKQNYGYKYILTIVDIFTRYAWARPLMTKTGAEVAEAFQKIFEESKRHPRFFYWDQGKEFLNKNMEALMEKYGIEGYHTYGRGKSAIVERFNKTLKTWMWKELTAQDSEKWLPLLKGLVERYNERKHGTLGITPKDASAHPIKALKRWNEIAEKIPKPGKPTFRIGDWVRIDKEKGPFAKGYTRNWTREIFRVTDVVDNHFPITYHLEDYWGEEIKGTFYAEQMQKVKYPKVRIIDKIVDKRGKGNKREALVSYVGFPEQYNEWVPYAEAQKV
jgi:hypothetical protein